MHKRVTNFLTLYQRGQLSLAAQEVFSSPTSDYSECEDGDPLNELFINYIDSLYFQSSRTSYLTRAALLKYLKTEQLEPLCTELAAQLTLEQAWNTLLYSACSEEAEYQEILKDVLKPFGSYSEAIDSIKKGDLGSLTKCLKHIPNSDHQMLLAQLAMRQGKTLLEKKKSFLFSFHSYPFLPLSYPGIVKVKHTKKTPFIILENYACDWESLLAQYSSRTVIFYIYSETLLTHCLQFSGLVKSLCSPKHLILIGGRYPIELFNAQNIFSTLTIDFELINLSPRPCINGKEILDVFMQALKSWQVTKASETASADHYYAVTRDLMDTIHMLRLNTTRFFSYKIQRLFRNRHDLYKGPKACPGPLPWIQELEKKCFASLPKYKDQKSFKVKKKKRLAHIVSLCSDSNHHAPSRILRSLLMNHDQEKYEVYLIIHEQNLVRDQVYPPIEYASTASREQGKRFLTELWQHGITIYIADHDETFVNLARDISRYLLEEEIDSVIYHEAPPISGIISHMTDIPLSVFIDHTSTIPQHESFDLLLINNLECMKIPSDKKADKRLIDFPVVTDCKECWKQNPPSRSDFPVPENAFIMSTISNYLSARLSDDNIWAICEILRRCPHAYYLPIGAIINDRLQESFTKAKLADRVFFLGKQRAPSQIFRSMDLYLNEFPFGGGVAILDAMASGTPVVSMYYNDGPPQGRYGGHFIGEKYRIDSCKKEDYVDFACQVIENKQLYLEYSKHISKQYQQRVSPKNYARNLECIIEAQLQNHEVSF